MVAEEKVQRLVSLLELSCKIGSQLELDALLQMVVDSARRFSQAALCGLVVLSEQDPRQFSGIWVSGWEIPPRHYPSGSGIFNLPLKTGKPLRVDSVPLHPGSVGVPEGHPPIGPFLGVPMRIKERIIGTLFVANLLGGTPFTADDEEIILALATQASGAIQNARLYHQVEELAILRERERMAINLHDTVAQIFFSIGMELDRLREAIPAGEQADRLQYLRSLVSSGTARVREAIGSLYDRGGLPEGANLHRELAALIEAFQKEHHLQVGLVVNGPVSRLSTPVAEVFCRAAREGLTNVRKHAKADMAVISLVVQDEAATMTIQDNGRGLKPGVLEQAPHVQRFGLEAIRRQIERLGGKLDVSNGDEGGCLLRIRAPLTQPVGLEGDAPHGTHSGTDRR